MSIFTKLFRKADTKPLPGLPMAPMGRTVMRNAVIMPTHAKVFRGREDRMLRMYDAALTNNLNVDIGPASITSANAEIFVSVLAVRCRARKAVRDNPYAKGIVRTYRNNVVGHDPYRLEMRVGKKDAKGKFVPESETNDLIQEAWKEAALPENCTIRQDVSRLELYHMAQASAVRDGGILAQHYRYFPNNKFKYAIDPIEVDRLDPNYNRAAVGTNNEIQFSIERNSYRAAVAFWILTRHPGDVFAWSNTPRYRERVEAADIIQFWNIRERAGQDIGMSDLDTIIQRLHRIDQFDIAHCTAAVMSAAKSIWIERTQTTASEMNSDEISREGEKFSNVTPGEAEILPTGYTAKQLDPKFPIETGPEFKKDSLRGVGAGAGIAYHTLANDLEGVNFSSGRLGENAQRDEFMVRQEHMIDNFVRPHFNTWLKYAILSGSLPLPITRLEEFQKAAEFNGRRWPYINPLQDAQASVLMIEAGLTSRDHEIINSERGGDVEKVNAEIASGRESDELHGLDFTNTDPTEPSIKKGVPGESVENPDVKQAPRKGAKQTIRADYERLERTWRTVIDEDPSEENKAALNQLLEWKGKRNGVLSGHHGK